MRCTIPAFEIVLGGYLSRAIVYCVVSMCVCVEGGGGGGGGGGTVKFVTNDLGYT